MEIFVPDYDWNSHWSSVEESAGECDYAEGEEFKMVRLAVGACTTYRIMDGKPVPVSVAFPEAAPNVELSGREEGTMTEETTLNALRSNAGLGWHTGAEMVSMPDGWYWAEFPGGWEWFSSERLSTRGIDHGDTQWHELMSKRYWGPFIAPPN